MFRRTLAITFAGILLCTTLGRQPVRAQSATAPQSVEAAHAKVQQLSVGRKTRVEVKLQDKTTLKGYITQAGADSFTLTDAKAGTSRAVAYADVAYVKKSGGGLSPLTWGLIGGAAAAAVITVIAVKPALCDGGAQSRFPC
ncbi:MAG TPA: hypothetical protein VF546_16725 [Pyrinomonadaceae bacterium]|jgi:hypothetical protein